MKKRIATALIYCFLSLLFCASCASKKGAELPMIYKEALYRNERGMALFAEGRNSDAANEFQRSLKINRSTDNRKGIAINLINLGRIHLEEQRLDEARVALDEATAISNSLNDQRLISEAYATMAKYFFAAGDNRQSMTILKKGMEIDQKEGFTGTGGKLNLAGFIYMQEGELTKAEASFNEALSKNLASEDTIETANSYRGMADLLEIKGMLRKAGESIEKALDNDKKGGVSRRIATDLRRLGSLALKENDINRALGYYLRSLDVDINSGDRVSAAVDLEIIAEIYKKSGDNEKALFYQDERMRILK